jgi:hypothetical protein
MVNSLIHIRICSKIKEEVTRVGMNRIYVYVDLSVKATTTYKYKRTWMEVISACLNLSWKTDDNHENSQFIHLYLWDSNSLLPIQYTKLLGEERLKAFTEFLEKLSNLFIRDTVYWLSVLIYETHVVVRPPTVGDVCGWLHEWWPRSVEKNVRGKSCSTPRVRTGIWRRRCV